MTRSDKQSFWLRIALLALIGLVAAMVEPCDGHSCPNASTISE